MKTIVLLVCMLTASFAIARDYVELGKNHVGLSLITKGEVLSVDTYFGNCPSGAQCMPAALIKVRLTLHGCMDQLGPVSASVRSLRGTNEYMLDMTAVNIHNKKSMVVRCVRAKTKVVTVHARPSVTMNNLSLTMNTYTVRVEKEPRRGQREMGHQPVGVRLPQGPRACTREYMPVCGIPEVICERGRICQQVIPTPGKTFSNRCELERAGAKFVHEGKCQQDRD